ncbi:MAG: sugar phosphate isomerase/epimerase [Synergistaceae bacterium]|nr:sugar phosphate isomerase/epimerase [Synergistaceae bacterium]
MISDEKRFRYSVSASIEQMSPKTPFMLQGDLRESVDILKSLGYDAVELQIRNPCDIELNWLADFCEKNSFSVSAIGTGSEYTLNHLSLTSPDVQTRRNTLARMKEHIDLADYLKTDVIVGTVRGNLDPSLSKAQYTEYLREALTELCGYALPKKVNLVLEAINFYVTDFFNSVGQASEMVELVSASNFKVHIDTHHMAVEEADMIKSIEECGGRIGYVHFSENNRLYPGGNGLNFTEVMRSLVKIGYSGYIALECLPKPDGITGCKLGLENLRKFEGQI